MRTTMKFAGLILAVAFSLASCDNNSQAKQQEIERLRQDSIQAAERAEKERAKQEAAERAEREAAERKQREENTFTSSKGHLCKVDATIQAFYNIGVSEGTDDKQLHLPYHHLGDGTEEAFKRNWTAAFGIPNNDKAKEVYNRALQKYIEGYEDGWNF